MADILRLACRSLIYILDFTIYEFSWILHNTFSLFYTQTITNKKFDINQAQLYVFHDRKEH